MQNLMAQRKLEGYFLSSEQDTQDELIRNGVQTSMGLRIPITLHPLRVIRPSVVFSTGMSCKGNP